LVRRSGGEDSEKWGRERESRALGDRFGGTMTRNNQRTVRQLRPLGNRFRGPMTRNDQRKVIELEQGWAFMQKGITKLKNLLEGVSEQQFNSEEYIMLYTYFSLFSRSSSSLGLPFLLGKGFGFVADFDTREFSYSMCRIVSGYSFFLDCACTGQFTICVHRSLRKITRNSFTTDIGSRLRSTSIVWYVSRGPLFSLFPYFCVCRER
jgi:hypothetical protein